MIDYNTRVSLVARLMIMLCVFAGMGVGLAHGSFHEESDHCPSHCESGHGDSHDPADSHDQDDHGSLPHQHACCQLPCADRVEDEVVLGNRLPPALVEIPAESSLAPEDPVFALDKPPLI